MKKPPAERRKSPRIEKSLPLSLTDATFDLATETKNISARGVYCRVDHHIPYMSKIMVTLSLPVQEKGRITHYLIRSRATVVRSESQIINHGKKEIHFVALYFEHLKRSDSQKIEEYVRTHLATRPALSSHP